MEDILIRILQGLGLEPDACVIESAEMDSTTNIVTVGLFCKAQLSDGQYAAVRETMQSSLPGLTLVLRCSYPRPLEQEHSPQKTDLPEETASMAQCVRPTVPPKDPNAPQTIFGSSIAANTPTSRIHNLADSRSLVVIRGRIVSCGIEEQRGKGAGKGFFRIQINVTDDNDSIYASCRFEEEGSQLAFLETLEGVRKKGDELLVRGVCSFGKFGNELKLFANDVAVIKAEKRQDNGDEKRVELHLHTRMSTMDGLTDVSRAFDTAKRFGHKALAITDHGGVQAFPDAKKASVKTGVKVLFGMEGYLISDTELTDARQTYVVFDIETTGLKKESCEIIEIGAVKIRDGEIIDRFSTFINNGVIIPRFITELTRITNDMIADAPPLREVLTDFQRFTQGACLVAHNADFDIGFIRFHGERYGLEFKNDYADTVMLSRYLIPGLVNYKLETVCEHFAIDISGHHRAVDDARATSEIFLHLLDMLAQRGIPSIPAVTWAQWEKAQHKGKGRAARKSHHIVILAATQSGMKNLYRLVSSSNLDYFHSHPNIPKSLLSIYRDGLILGSACEQGELYQTMLHGGSEEELEKIASEYDFLEIQPVGNNAFMVREGIVPDEDALRDLNRRIVELGKRLHIPVAATGDVHFLEPQDSIYRAILMSKLGFEDADKQAPLYFKSTDEMLEEFSYLGQETAREVVIQGPNRIADLCGELKPFPDGTHAPKIENAEDELRDMAVDTARRIYGDPLPSVVQARLDRELKSIIGNGFASLYLMAQRLVQKSNSDGYLVGSRGSVGSSFVATMAGITEVNPLQPHYVCPQCRFSDFEVDLTQYYTGADMPDRDCPKCGTKLKKEGFEIPFEVFLGFKGDKTPDIDLNFSGEYQPRAHKYVEEMFGVGHAFRAGTISGIAERKAYECIYAYGEARGLTLRRAEQERLCLGCLNTKVTTGQHPGGIVIVPKDEDILDFTPIQYPADKKDKNTITTHFDFHAMDDRLVKLDILGHDDPTALRMLQDLTGLDPRSIPLDDPDTRRIYSSAEPLKINLSGLGCDVGTLGVPEFGTGFVRGVLENTRPTTIEELVRIAGLTHGTDVWLNNAEPLVMNGIAKLNEVLCTRDDIMNYLIAHGMDAALSFSIMEKVRKGKGLTPEMEQAMLEGKIPDWFIDSCKKIKYMFPRGHAVAYTMMSFRIAYYKVHYPLEFYAVYYTARADAFDVTLALGGADRVLATIKQIERDAASKDFAERKRLKEIQTILEVVYEMNLRGIPLLPIDIYKSQGTRFTIEDGAIRPPFNAIPGVGNNAALSLVENRGDARFLSMEDFQKRTGANSAFTGMLEQMGCFGSMPKTNQISLF